MKRWIVELEVGELGMMVWIASYLGDPGRTIFRDNARRYSRLQDAKGALTRARKFRPFPHARIVEIEEVENG